MSSGGRIGFDLDFRTRRQPQHSATADDDHAKHLLVAADFSGRSARGAQESLTGRRAYRVDCDTLDAVMAGFECRISVPAHWATDGALSIDFAALEDFHPDALVSRIPELGQLLSARSALDAGGGAAAARAEALLQIGSATPPASEGTTAPTQVAPPESTSDTLARLLGKPREHPRQAESAAPAVDSLIRQILTSSTSVTPAAPAGTAGLVSACELTLAERLRDILHHPHIRAVEAAWRGLDFLVRRCPDAACGHVFLCDATAEELVADATEFASILRRGGFQILVVDARILATGKSFELLGQLAHVCHEAGATMVAGGHPNLAGCDDFAVHPDPDDWQVEPAPAAWSLFRSTPAASQTHLAVQRVVARQPYGKAGNPIVSFPFEELCVGATPPPFPWMSAAYVLGLALIQSTGSTDRSTHSGVVVVLDDLPAARYVVHGGTALMPSVEAWLSDRAVGRLLSVELVALQGNPTSDSITVNFPV